ncbi:hypothetical protein [Pseudonocardia thermophila]|uniref:hypothetical protein n=1 Tax=Pseudonocardia thermophila TaxID=1848 RepID=UPI00248EDB08|nr:hypothetical protein [Pseudonocardia thermophila]
MNRLLRRLLGREPAPDGSIGALEPDEHVLAWAAIVGGGHLVTTSHGIWFPDPDEPRRVGWHLVSKATWQGGALVLVEAVEEDTLDGVVLLADRPPRRFGLGEPGKVPQVVHERVTGSIRSRHHRGLPGGGAWFVQRKVAGRGKYVLQVRPDPGTDRELVRRLAAEVGRQLPS